MLIYFVLCLFWCVVLVGGVLVIYLNNVKWMVIIMVSKSVVIEVKEIIFVIELIELGVWL